MPDTTGAGEILPSMAGALLRLAAALGVLLAAAAAWVYWQRRLRRPQRRLEVLDRTFLARGAGLVLIRVAGKRLLVGVSTEGVRLVQDLDPGPALPEEGAGTNFDDLYDGAVAGAERAP